MTQRLYYTDSYLQHFEAAVTDRADGSRRIYLDRTAFYPTSGGQPFDTGKLGGVQVTDVIDEGDRVAHVLDAPLVGERVTGEIDWQRRFDHMQQHTGQHLLSAVLADQLGQQTAGVHFGRQSSTIDLQAGPFNEEQARRAEAAANEIVVQNRPVVVSFEEAESATGLRKPPERAGKLRVITIEDVDRSACGGTHVAATGEIGSILIRKVERVRRGVRLEFLCGSRAIRESRADYELVSQLAAEHSASAEELPRLMDVQREALKRLAAANRELAGKLNVSLARELYAQAAPESTGLRRVIRREENGSLESLRGLAQAFTSMPMTLFVGTVPSPPALLLAVSPDAGINAAGMLEGLLADVGGRGGGSARLAQGILPGPAQLNMVVESLGKGPGSGKV